MTYTKLEEYPEDLMDDKSGDLEAKLLEDKNEEILHGRDPNQHKVRQTVAWLVRLFCGSGLLFMPRGIATYLPLFHFFITAEQTT
jgi:hypothetical protein